MKPLLVIPVWLWIVLGFSMHEGILPAGTVENSYLSIAARNVFGLSPPQKGPAEPPTALSTRVRLVGITTLCGKWALLKIYLPPQPPEPARQVAYNLEAGQRAGPLELLEIDEQEGSVKLRISGIIMVLTLDGESGRFRMPSQPWALPSSPIRATRQE